MHITINLLYEDGGWSAEAEGGGTSQFAQGVEGPGTAQSAVEGLLEQLDPASYGES